MQAMRSNAAPQLFLPLCLLTFSASIGCGVELEPSGAAEASAPKAAEGQGIDPSAPETRTPAVALVPTTAQAPDGGTDWTQERLEAESLAIQKEIEELRGAKFNSVVAVKLSSKEQFVSYALERTERMDPAPKRAADETIQKMLGLIPHDMDLLAESMRLLQDQVGGFYDPATKTFYLMDNCPEGIAKVVLSHELAHALDDQLYDIDGTLSRIMERSDVGMAYQSVVEGSGTAVMNRWTVKNMKSIDLSGLSSMQEEQSASMARAPMILWKPLLGAYLNGAAFLARTDSILQGQTKTATNADLDQAFRFPPKSTEQVLHPEKYWDEDERDEPLSVAQAIGALPEGWSVLRKDVAGEMVLGIWTISPSVRSNVDPAVFSNPLGVEYTTAASEGWGGDEIVLLGKGETARALRWLTVWDSDRDAAEFFGSASVIVPDCKSALIALAGGDAKLASCSVRYGAEREVVIEMCFGVKSLEAKKVFRAFDAR